MLNKHIEKKVDFMLLGAFLEEYNRRKNERNAFNTICRENGISYKKLPDLLKELFYKYDKSQKQWIYEHEGDQPLEIDLADAIPARTSPATLTKQTSRANDTQAENIQPAPAAQAEKQITNDQLFDIVYLLQQINSKIPDQVAAKKLFDPALEDPDAAPLALQLHRINQAIKTRKTINISSTAASWLDSFSETKGYKIGDLVTLAIIQLQKRLDSDYKVKE